MSKYKTLDEYFPDGKPDGRAFKLEIWYDKPHYFFKPFYKARLASGSYIWCGVDENNFHVQSDCDGLFKEWHQPKKRVTKYLWYNNYSKVVYPYMAKCIVDLQEQLHCNGTYVHKGDGNYTRLDWSATEFDDE